MGSRQSLKARCETSLPPVSIKDAIRLLYVFCGRITVAGITLKDGESIVLKSDDDHVIANENSDLVLFTTTTSGAVFTGGMFSGNVLGA